MQLNGRHQGAPEHAELGPGFLGQPQQVIGTCWASPQLCPPPGKKK